MTALLEKIENEATALSRAEMKKAAMYYENCAAGLGFRFLAEVEEVFGRIKGYPATGQTLKEPYCRALLQKFPYGVIYRQRANTGYVVAVMHLKRKPGYWLYRVAESEEG